MFTAVDRVVIVTVVAVIGIATNGDATYFIIRVGGAACTIMS